jgi:SHS2 domain-containing protein
MKKFEVLDISGDIGLRAYGEDIKEAFINTALGMYSLITTPDLIEEKKTIGIRVEGSSIEGLLISWLNELIFNFDAYGFIGGKITINEFTPSLALPPPYTLKVSVSGEDFDPERHERKLLIKAATYHRLRIEKVDDMWEIDVIFDI